MNLSSLYAALVFFITVTLKGCFGEYYGKFIGDIRKASDGFSGRVYAVDEKRVYITEMNYDGLLVDGRFCVGRGKGGPSASATLIPDEDGRDDYLQNYTNSRVLLELPEKITSYDYIGVCKFLGKKKWDGSSGHVDIPARFQLPEEQKLGALKGASHNVTAVEVILKDSATIELIEFGYDGNGTDTHFAVGPTIDGPAEKLTKLPDESGSHKSLKAYSNENVILKLPDGHHWNEYKWFTVFSFKDGTGFASLEIKEDVATMLPVHNPTSKVRKSKPVIPAGLLLLGFIILIGIPLCCCCCCCCGIGICVYLFTRKSEEPMQPAGGYVPPGAQYPGSAQWAPGQPAAGFYGPPGAENPAAAQWGQAPPAPGGNVRPGAENEQTPKGKQSGSE